MQPPDARVWKVGLLVGSIDVGVVVEVEDMG